MFPLVYNNCAHVLWYTLCIDVRACVCVCVVEIEVVGFELHYMRYVYIKRENCHRA
jgi:hypothetical protein